MKKPKLGELLWTALLVALVLAVLRQVGVKLGGPVGSLLSKV